MIDATQVGHSGAVVFHGEPAIGKTALLGYAAGRATGMPVLHCTGVKTEAELDAAAAPAAPDSRGPTRAASPSWRRTPGR